MIWTAVYYRHHARCEAEMDSLAEALSFLASGLEHDELMPYDVLNPEGQSVFPDRVAFDQAIDARSSGL